MTQYTPREPVPGEGDGPIAGAGMTEEAELLFRDWMQGLVEQDIRYNTKAIGLLVREAMVDEDVRARVLEDPEGALREIGSQLELPDEFTVRFFENTYAVLNVVLPPPADLIARYFDSDAEHLAPLRERLRSRTADFPTLFHDDWNLSNAGNDLSLGMLIPPA